MPFIVLDFFSVPLFGLKLKDGGPRLVITRLLDFDFSTSHVESVTYSRSNARARSLCVYFNDCLGLVGIVSARGV